MNEVCQFKAEVDADEGFENTSFYLEADLFFHKKQLAETNFNMLSNKLHDYEFSCVAT